MKRLLMAAVSAAILLAACGGSGGNNGETKASFSAVKVVGASLADSGTFGYKFTVQSGGSTTYKVYSERIAATYGVSDLCNAYSYNGSTFVANTSTTCTKTNYAIGGGVVNYVVSGVTYDSTPLSLVKQLTDAATAGFSSSDLLIVGEGSANDAATLATAYLTSLLAGTTASTTAEFRTLLGSLIDSTTLAALSDVNAGGYYMQLLAHKLVTAVNTSALSNGVSHVVILNTLDVTQTPRFQLVMAQLTAATNATTAASVQALLQGWIQTYNTALNTEVAALGSDSSKVAVVDFYTNFNDELADLAQYGLTNKTATVCDQVYSIANSVTPTVTTAGTTSLSTTAVVGACTDTAASATTPTENNTGTSWWKTYLFADNFHPTPYGHQLLAQLVAKRLTEAGWL